MSLADEIDATSLQDLRSRGGLKWTMPDAEIGAFVAETDFGTAPEVVAALHRAVDGAAFGYLPTPLLDDLKAATAERLNAVQGWNAVADDIFVAADVIKVLEVTIERFSRPGSKVIVPTPAYMPFLFIPPAVGREVIEVPMLNDDGISRFDIEGIQRAFDDGGNLLVLCNPYNPLGRVFTRDELVAVSEIVDRNDGRVFADEIWAPLVYPGHDMTSYATISEAAAAHTITGMAASKAWNVPGLKCAQLVVSNDADRERMRPVADMVAHGASNLGVVATTAAYRSGQGWLDEVLEYLEGNKRDFVELTRTELPGVRGTVPEGTYVGWLDFSETNIDDPAAFFRDNAGVALTNGRDCGVAGAGCARFIFAMPRPILHEAFERMGKAMRERAH